MRSTRAIIILGLLLMIKGALLLLVFSTILTIFTAGSRFPAEITALLPVLTENDLVESSAYLVIGTFLLLGGVGVLRLRGWGWLLAMIGQGIDLVIGLMAYTRGEPQYVQMLIDVLLVLYLNQRDVYVVFANAKRRDGALQVGKEESVAPFDAAKAAELAELEPVDERR